MTRTQFRIIIFMLTVLLVLGMALLYIACTLHLPPPATVAAWPETPATLPSSPTLTPVEPTALPPTWTPTGTWTPWPTPTEPPPTPTFTKTPTPTPTPVPTMPPMAFNPRRPTLAPTRFAVTLHPSSTLKIPTPVPRQPIPEDAITVVLLGSDQRPNWTEWHTDAIQYVVIHPHVPSVSMLSIPRDLYVLIPDSGMNRINMAHVAGESTGYPGGGMGLFNQTLLHNLGITADYYVKVDFDGLIGLVNAMGGIDVPVYCRLEDHWPYPNEAGEYPWFVLPPGIHHLDGEQALWYARSRKTSSVFSRERRQQQVLESMWHRAKRSNLLATVPTLYDQWGDLIQTDLGLGKIASLAVVAARLEPDDVDRYNIGYGQVQSHVTPYGGYVFLPLWSEIEPILRNVLLPPASSRAAQAAVPIEIWNGTGHGDWDQLASDRLAHAGFAPVLGASDGDRYPQTKIVFFGSTTKGSGLARLQSLFRVPDGRVITQDDPHRVPQLLLILGEDYDPCK